MADSGTIQYRKKRAFRTSPSQVFLKIGVGVQLADLKNIKY